MPTVKDFWWSLVCHTPGISRSDQQW